MFVIAGSYSFFTVLNTAQELLLRQPSYPHSHLASLFWWVGGNALLFGVGLVAWANFQLLKRLAKKRATSSTKYNV